MGDVRADTASESSTSAEVKAATPTVPTRTCVGCRGKGSRSALLRIVVDDAGTELVLDSRKTMPGRGAWLHPDVECLTKAVTRRAWGRALKLRTSVRSEALQRMLTEHVSTRSPSGDEEPHTAASHDHDRKRV